jgi:hypothetical protein
VGFNINWQLLGQPVDVAGAVWDGMDKGIARRERAELHRARMEDVAFQRGERERGAEYRSALGDLMLNRHEPQQAAFGDIPGRRTSRPMGPTEDVATARVQSAFAPLAAPNAGIAGEEADYGRAYPGRTLADRQPALGAPQVAQLPPSYAAPMTAPTMSSMPDPAYERAVRADPERFLTYQGKRIEVDSKRLEQLRDLNDSAMQILGGVYDDATLQAGKARARLLYQQFGVPTDTIEALPDTFSPEMVRSLQMQGMDTSKQLAAVARENKLDWDIRDDLYDNERADRNTDSMVQTRQGQLANVQRGQDLTHSRGLRGQDISSRDRNRGVDVRRDTTVRGQDLTDTRVRRGQDITDRRGRESASFKGTGGRGGKAGASVARIVNPQTGQAMILRNGKWVPES